VFAYLPALDAADAGYAVVTERFLCLLGSDTSVEATRELYRALAADPVHLDDVLDAIVARHALEHFAIVEMIDAEQRTMNIAVRGRVTANLDGSTTTRLSGPTGATWITGEARGVSALALSLDLGTPGTEALPIRRGVVRALSVTIESTADAAAPVFVDVTTPPTVPIDVPRIREATVRAELAAARAEQARPDRPVSRATRIDMAELAGPPAPPEAPAMPASKTELVAAPDAEAPEAEPTAAPAKAPEPATPSANSPDAEAPAADNAADSAHNPADNTPARLLVRLPDGNELPAGTPIVIGRRPWSVESDTQSAVHVAVPSPKREVSATHLQISEEGGALVARDLGSTNGTVVITPSRAPRLLDGHRRTELVEGDVLDLGEGFHIVIVNHSTL